jgi:hypothetical protein
MSRDFKKEKNKRSRLPEMMVSEEKQNKIAANS